MSASVIALQNMSFQSTPARGGRHRVHEDLALHVLVSIHARTRRATAAPDLLGLLLCVSIHARTRRATRSVYGRSGEAFGFNPRPHAAGDDVGDRDCPAVHVVSIHARTRRATLGLGRLLRNSGFQSTPARGGRRASTISTATGVAFQSTPARGGRPECNIIYLLVPVVSIHARTRRATLAKVAARQNICFNPRPHAAGDKR